MATQNDSLKTKLDRQIAGQIAYGEVTEIVEVTAKDPSTTASQRKKHPEKAPAKKQAPEKKAPAKKK